jgi:hypothetical protein
MFKSKITQFQHEPQELIVAGSFDLVFFPQHQQRDAKRKIDFFQQ